MKYYLSFLSFLSPFILSAQSENSIAESVNIWITRSISLEKSDCKAPVIVAIWDTGVDMETVPVHNRWINPNEKKDGLDNDGNGCIDDIHGITYNNGDNTVENTLFLKAEYDSLSFKRLDSLLKTNAISELERKVYEKQKTDLDGKYERQLVQFSIFNHGTHVAGIAVEGNPAIQIMVVRRGLKNSREKPNFNKNESAKAYVARLYFANLSQSPKNTRLIGQYVKQNKAKVVNMSWTMPSLKELQQIAQSLQMEDSLRLKKANEEHQAMGASVQEVISQSPEILFIAAAGNYNDDPNFEERFPAGFDFPNLLVVGAVDKAGKATPFTGLGKGVQVFADGFEVESFIPGGKREKKSGTSMAAPQVTNLAAKMLAIKPHLTPVQIKDFIIKNSDKNTEGYLLINPKKAIEFVRNM
jgi:subtilisin family serine protease